MNFICFNGNFIKEDEPVITVMNRGYKWGDALFETIKVIDGKILLKELHFERLFLSLQLLKIDTTQTFTIEIISEKILELCKKNNCSNGARVRLEVFRSENNWPGYSLEAIPLSTGNSWNKEGLEMDLFPYGRKSCDGYANLKTANYLIYILAKLHAQEKGIDDCIVLNTDNKIADTSKANIFLIKNRTFFTPALNQGCINGVMRRFLIDELKANGFIVHQTQISEEDIFAADEMFITNAIIGLQWVKKIKQKEFGNALSASIFEKILLAI